MISKSMENIATQKRTDRTNRNGENRVHEELPRGRNTNGDIFIGVWNYKE